MATKRKMFKDCKICGLRFKVWADSRGEKTNTCSYACRGKLTSAVRLSSGGKKIHGVCLGCGLEFSKYKNITNPKFCSRKCYLKSDNIFARSPTRAKARATLLKSGYAHLRTRKNEPTKPQLLLFSILGSGWELELPQGTKPWTGGPKSYWLDIGNRKFMLDVECDGNSHRTKIGRVRDERRDAFLRSKGWTVLRFSNESILSDTDSVVSKIRSMMQETLS